MNYWMRTIRNCAATTAWLYVMANLTGCGAMGVRNVDLWGAKMEFYPGFDVNVGANAIDKVDNRKGISKFEK